MKNKVEETFDYYVEDIGDHFRQKDYGWPLHLNHYTDEIVNKLVGFDLKEKFYEQLLDEHPNLIVDYLKGTIEREGRKQLTILPLVRKRKKLVFYNPKKNKFTIKDELSLFDIYNKRIKGTITVSEDNISVSYPKLEYIGEL
jgi:hypothetical protein